MAPPPAGHEPRVNRGWRLPVVGSPDLVLRRLAATAVDYTLAATPLAAFALVNAARGAFRRPRRPSHGDEQVGPWLRWVGVPLLVDLPVCLALGYAEARGGSPGKRLLGIEVVSDHRGGMTAADAVTRTVLKVAVPWELGHQAAWEFATGHNRRGTTLVLASQAWTVLQVRLMRAGEGRTWADAVAGTRVTRRRSCVDAERPT